MDPNVTLAELRALIAELDRCPPSEHWIVTADDLVEHVRALDQWLTAGGFLPLDWAANP